MSQGALAAAIAVPVAVTLLGGGLLLWWCLRRHRRSKRALDPITGNKAIVGAAVLGDLEKGGGPLSGQGGTDLQVRSRRLPACIWKAALMQQDGACVLWTWLAGQQNN